MFLKIYNKELTEKLQNLLNSPNIAVYDYRYRIAFSNKEEAVLHIPMVSDIMRETMDLDGYIDLIVFEYKGSYWIQSKDIKTLITSDKIKKRKY